MDRRLISGLLLGGVAAASIGAGAGYKLIASGPTYAQVLGVEPQTRSVSTPNKRCWTEAVAHHVPTRDPDQVAGTVIGALAGGLLGNQVGSGRGRTAATVVGAAAGGYAGNKVQEKMQAGDTYQVNETRCTTSYDTVQVPDGYLVHYKLDDREGSVRMDHDPGARIPVKDGQLVLTPTGP